MARRTRPHRRPLFRKRLAPSCLLYRFAPPTEVPGLAARRIAADILDGVLHKRRTLDDQLDGAAAHPGLKTLSDRDRALMRRLVATILRRLGTLGHVLSRLLDRGIPTDAPRAAKRAADRRRANSLDGRARSRRGRPVGAAGAVGPARREICRPRQRGAAPLRARGPAADRRGRRADAGRAAVADGALDRALRRSHRKRNRHRDRP